MYETEGLVGTVPPLTEVSGFRGGWFDENDPTLSELCRKTRGRYENLRDKTHNIMKKYGVDKPMWHQPVEDLEYTEGKTDYTKPQLEQMADTLLRQYGKKELCRECLSDLGDEIEGEETGHVEAIPQFKDGDPVLHEGGHLYLDLPELQCQNGHQWYLGEGKSRGNAGDNAVLFEEHLIQRRRREIYTTEGVPDPSIVSGIYNRVHPQGRKVNTDAQRKNHGASFYR